MCIPNSKALLFSLLIALFVKSTIGVRCWVCDEQTEIECFINGSEMDCPNRQDTCFYEQRQRLGETYHVRQGCQQENACRSQWERNTHPSGPRFSSCKPKTDYNNVRMTESFCTQCCDTEACGYLWTPKSIAEWTVDTRIQPRTKFTFSIN